MDYVDLIFISKNFTTPRTCAKPQDFETICSYYDFYFAFETNRDYTFYSLLYRSYYLKYNVG